MSNFSKYILPIFLFILVVILVILGYLYLPFNNSNLPKLKPLSFIQSLNNINSQYEFSSEIPNYELGVGDTNKLNDLSSDLEILTSGVKTSKIRVIFNQYPLDEYQGLGYTVLSDSDKNYLISNSTSLYYPEENIIEFRIYIDKFWLEDPTIATPNIQLKDSSDVNELLSFQFTYLLSNLNYNKTLTLIENKESYDPRLEFTNSYLRMWENQSNSYPLKLTKRNNNI